MKVNRIAFSALCCVLLLAGCGRPAITLRVLDAQTKEPIEGAVAIAWWTTAHGLPGLTYHKTARVGEKMSGADGTFTLSPVPFKLSGQIPNIRVYKPGYVGWDNFSIYKGILFDDFTRAHLVKRTDFEYKSQDIFLERWKEEYSHGSHYNFLTTIMPIDYKNYDSSKSLFTRAVDSFELPMKIKETNNLINKAEK